MKSLVKQYLPTPIQSIIRNIYYSITDNLDLLLGKRDSMTPPRSKIFVGAGDYKEVGQEFLKHFREKGNLQPDDTVLDVGCGIGRMAVPLTSYLSSKGKYYGFDIVTDGINWCQKNIAAKHTNFHFQWASIYNAMYNPTGKSKAVDYKFLYESNKFDFVFLTSVFTHMVSEEMQNYLGEISRVLKPGGRCFINFFLVNPEAKALISSGKSKLNFIHDLGNGSITCNKDLEEFALAYDEVMIRKLFEQNNLEITGPVNYGSWSGRENFLSYQDIIIATKKI